MNIRKENEMKQTKKKWLFDVAIVRVPKKPAVRIKIISWSGRELDLKNVAQYKSVVLCSCRKDAVHFCKHLKGLFQFMQEHGIIENPECIFIKKGK